jgi:ferredoxin-NADP reductase
VSVAQRLHCTVKRITAHGGGTYTLVLIPERPLPRFLPGQFLHLALDAYDPSGFWPESRVFSIASSPQNRQSLEITYSVKGRFSARMEADLHPGSEVWIKMPYGEFIIDANHPAALFAGGTGITAFTAFLEGLSPPLKHPVAVFYGARQRQLLIYRPLVDHCIDTLPGFRALFFLEQTGELAENERKGWLSLETSWPYIANPAQTRFYLSGPPAMWKTLSDQLLKAGIGQEQVCVDAWE